VGTGNHASLTIGTREAIWTRQRGWGFQDLRTVLVESIRATITVAVEAIGAVRFNRLREASQFTIVAVPEAARPGVAITIKRPIGDSITVIIKAITPVRSPRADARVRVVAVATAGGEAIFVIVQKVREAITIAIGVRDAGSNGARSNHRIAIVTVPLTDRVTVGVEIPGVVNQAVAVVVTAIAELCSARKDGGLIVIAVPLAAADLIAVRIDILIDISIAIIVQTVLAVLKSQRPHEGVVVITIGQLTERSAAPETILIDVLFICGQRAIAVRIQAVTDLDCLRIHQRHPRLAVLAVWAAIPILILIG